MIWRTGPLTGRWVAYDGKNYYSIESVICFVGKKPCRRYRVRVNQSSIGGAEPKLFKSVNEAKKYVESL
jgi:hypothetical protein